MGNMTTGRLLPHYKSEQELISRLGKLDEAAFYWVWHMYYDKLVQYAARLTQNAGLAEELVSIVFQRFLDVLCLNKGPSRNVRSYLYRMTYHTVIDHSRARAETDPLEESLPEEMDTPEEAAESNERSVLINRALETLTEDQRNLIILRYIEGLTMRETAVIMSKSLNAIKSMQRRAVNSLQKTEEFQQLTCEGIPGE